MTRTETWMIEEVGVGARDVGRPVLWFTVTNGIASAALQVLKLESDEARELLAAVYEVRELNGRLCHVDLTDNTVRFVKLLRAPRRL